MALLFLKKLAEKILGKPSAARAAAPAKKQKSQPQQKSRKPGNKTRDEKGGQKGVAGEAPRSSAGGRGRKPRDPAERGGNRPGSSQKRRSDRRSRSAVRDQEGIETLTPVVAGGRSIVRPHGQEGDRDTRRRRRGGGRGIGTAPGRQRPGGAISEEELQKLREAHASWSIDQFQVPEEEGKKRFHDYDLPSEVMHGIADLGFKYCTPIQALSLEHSLAGKNVAGRAQTGTGKTAAFLVAILTRYLRTPEGRPTCGGIPRTLVLAPTRELVIQICKDAEALGKYCMLRTLAVYGGMDYERQREEVRSAPVDLLVATPGRLLDFVRSRVVDLSHVDTLVIDEADRMLDMGFIPDVRSIINRLPPKDKRSTMLYSATLSDDVMRLASQWMEEPVRAEVECEHLTTSTVKQIVYVVTARQKFTVLYNHIQQYPDSRTLIFCNRKHTTEDVANGLMRRGIRCEMLSGDVNQNRRLRVLDDFREGKVRIVVATDVAGRGLHVDDIGFVINFDFPYEPEDYVHRIGRTGRAGASGTAISFADEDESFIIPDIEEYIGEELKCTMIDSDDPLLKPLPDRRRSPRRGESSRKSRAEGEAGTPVQESPAQETGTPAHQEKPVKAGDTFRGEVESAPKNEMTPVAPEASPVASETAPVAPEASLVAPETAPVVPEASPVAPETAPVVPEASETVVERENPDSPSPGKDQPVKDGGAESAPDPDSGRKREKIPSPKKEEHKAKRAPFIRPRNEPFHPANRPETPESEVHQYQPPQTLPSAPKKEEPRSRQGRRPPRGRQAGGHRPPQEEPSPSALSQKRAQLEQVRLSRAQFTDEWVPGEDK